VRRSGSGAFKSEREQKHRERVQRRLQRIEDRRMRKQAITTSRLYRHDVPCRKAGCIAFDFAVVVQKFARGGHPLAPVYLKLVSSVILSLRGFLRLAQTFLSLASQKFLTKWVVTQPDLPAPPL